MFQARFVDFNTIEKKLAELKEKHSTLSHKKLLAEYLELLEEDVMPFFRIPSFPPAPEWQYLKAKILARCAFFCQADPLQRKKYYDEFMGLYAHLPFEWRDKLTQSARSLITWHDQWERTQQTAQQPKLAAAAGKSIQKGVLNAGQPFSFEGLRLPKVKMTHGQFEFQTFCHAHLVAGDLRYSDLIAANFDATDLSDADLSCSLAWLSAFTSKTKLSNTNFEQSILIGATCDGQPITRAWLKEKGAQNTEHAITSIQELTEAILTGLLTLEDIQRIYKNFDELYGNLNSLKIRLDTNTIRPGGNIEKAIPFATTATLSLLFEVGKILQPMLKRAAAKANTP